MLSIKTFTWGWIILAVITFIYLLFFKTAPYGRHTSQSWGPTISNKLGWIIMEFPALFGFLAFFFVKAEYTNKVVFLFLILWCVHYVNRTFVFPFRIKTKGKKMPLVIALNGAFFNTINTYLIASFLAENPTNYTVEWFSTWQFILGFVLFVLGFWINQYSDYLLIKLRNPGETNYKIPHGFLFKYISSPNFFGEILEWLGFALLTWCLPSFAFLLWTIANLVPRAIANHKWYHNKFENYPKDRKAIIPFIW